MSMNNTIDPNDVFRKIFHFYPLACNPTTYDILSFELHQVDWSDPIGKYTATVVHNDHKLAKLLCTTDFTAYISYYGSTYKLNVRHVDVEIHRLGATECVNSIECIDSTYTCNNITDESVQYSCTLTCYDATSYMYY
jgi:hypothetical protein